jgi:hypothetical protein
LFPSGEADFDRQFLVEGAPFDVVKLLFDARAHQLMHHMRDELSREVLEGFFSLVGRIRAAAAEREAQVERTRRMWAKRKFFWER